MNYALCIEKNLLSFVISLLPFLIFVKNKNPRYVNNKHQRISRRA